MTSWDAGKMAQENAARLQREADQAVRRAKGERCQAVTLVGYRRCRKPATWPAMRAGRERYVCGVHYEADLFFDSPEYLSSPGYAARVRTSQTRPGTMTFTTLRMV